MMLNLDARDSNNRSILRIIESELAPSTQAWDATFVGQSLRVRSGPGQLLLELQFYPPNRIVLSRYKILAEGVVIDIDSTKIALSGDLANNINLGGNGTVSANIGVLVGNAPAGLGVGIFVCN